MYDPMMFMQVAMSTGRRLKAGRTLAVFSGVLGYGVPGIKV